MTDPFPDTSMEAFRSRTVDGIKGQRLTIVKLILAAGFAGMTCDEIEIRSKMIHQTCSAQICELVKDGRLIDSGRRRNTRTGRKARVYIIKPEEDQGRLFEREPRHDLH